MDPPPFGRINAHCTKDLTYFNFSYIMHIRKFGGFSQTFHDNKIFKHTYFNVNQI